MFHWFEQLIDPFQPGPDDRPPTTLVAFYWRYVQQVWQVFAVILIIGLVAALIEVSLFAFLGRIVDLVKESESPRAFFAQHSTMLLWMAFIAMIARPALFTLHAFIVQQSVVPGFTNLVRWQNHRYVLRQSLEYFQNDFAGRIANRIMQTGPAVRQSMVEATNSLWFVLIYTISALVLFFQADAWLTAPLLLWVAAYVATLWYFVPRLKERAHQTSDARSNLTGRIVDSYTNMLTVKLFAHAEREDGYAKEAVAEHNRRFAIEMRLLSMMQAVIWTLNGLLIVGTVGLALYLWSGGWITIGAIALTAGLVIRINNMSQWIMWVVANIFENIGTVQEGMETISQPHTVVDRQQAPPLRVDEGDIRYENIRFHYGKGRGVIDDLSLTIRPGEKVGLVGRSGAGKSTLVSLLLRFYDLEGGRILIDGQDIASVAQDSLRAKIGMVTQDTSLLHRSIMDNIIYGRAEGDDIEALAAAEKAHATPFIPELVDATGRRGYEAHVGERGVKLSGGQRQRIAIARVLMKNAPILILDEATSALDSEVEAAIQEQLYNLMSGKTVIAIAHRLSTIAAMDRLIVMERGAIVEEGTHDSLIRNGGTYAQLWARQSGGFIARESAA